MLVLHASPHPDDELIGAPATLMALRDAGHEIVNLACSFGRPDEATTRRAELEEACRRAGFELVADTEPAELLRERRFDVVIGPSPHDRHPAHETVGRSLVEAAPERLWLWGLWGALPFPTTVVEYGDARLQEIHHALEAHQSQIQRNDFRRLVTGRGLAGTVLGAELVFGFGSAGLAGPYAELTTEVVRTDAGWRQGAPRLLDPEDPFPEPTDRDIGGWLRARSAVDT